jgi:thioredoxin reductase (NADPH)
VAPKAVRSTGQRWHRWTPRSHEIRDLLDRNAIPYQFLPHDSQAGQRLLREVGQDGTLLPVLVLFDGQVLVDPTNAEAAAAIGVATRPDSGRYDLVVVGAGLEASLPGVFAAGDVRHRSIKRVASAVGEGSIAIQLVHEYLGAR